MREVSAKNLPGREILQDRSHPAETALLWATSIQLIAMPWMLGCMREWGQWISFSFALISFVLSLLPRNYTQAISASNSFRLVMWTRLTRFPLFWIGLALFIYIAVQAVNPAWSWQTDGVSWWMREVPHSNLLPTSVDVPFERGGPWRSLLVYLTTWFTVCAIWVGFLRRRTLKRLFVIIALNGTALAIFGLAQRLTGNGLMFWFWRAPGTPFSTFIYKNHAGAYLNLALILSCGLVAFYYVRGRQRLEKSNPAGAFGFSSVILSLAIVASLARGATVMMLLLLTVGIGVFFYRLLFVGPSDFKIIIILFPLVLVFGLFLKLGLSASKSGFAWDRLEKGFSGNDISLQSRNVATEASIEMLKDHWIMGWGAGSFRFMFPIYQQRFPFIWSAPNGGGMYQGRMYWDHAHNDLVELPLELGVPGVALILVGLAWIGSEVWRTVRLKNPLVAFVCFGLLLFVAYSRWDFPFQCPAILCLWWSLAVGCVIWARHDRASGGRSVLDGISDAGLRRPLGRAKFNAA